MLYNYDKQVIGLLLMFQIIFGILLGVVIVTYYPEISETTTKIFVDSGARDAIIEQLEEVN